MAAAVPQERPFSPVLYRLGWSAGRIFTSTYVRVRVHGIRSVPGTGGVILACNHQSFLDPLHVGTRLSRMIHFLARSSLFRVPLLGPFIRAVGAIPVERGAADRDALRILVELAAAGRMVCMFPEGTRSADGSMGPLRRGIALVARMAAVPVVPVGIAGAGKVWPKGKRLPRPGRVEVSYGDPIPPETIAGEGGIDLLAGAIARLAGVQPPPPLTHAGPRETVGTPGHVSDP
jgi:1-acyl-sn-glycerol-3-phosphate acyltransferase